MQGTIQYFWGIQRPDGKLVPQTFSVSKHVTEWNASRLCKKQHRMPWKNARKKYGYKLVKIEAKILFGTQREPTILDRLSQFFTCNNQPMYNQTITYK